MLNYSLDEILHAIRVIYEYNCEKFDAELVQSRFGELILGKDGCVFLPDGYTRSESMRNTNAWQKWVDKMLYMVTTNKRYYIEFTKDVARLTYDGLKREYENIPKDMMDIINGLDGVIATYNY
jgi:hypothetical protein